MLKLLTPIILNDNVLDRDLFMDKITENYKDPDGNSPFEDVLNASDRDRRAKIMKHRTKASLGLGSNSPLGDGLSENRDLSKGPGIRVYYANLGNLVLILLAGDKSTQINDIKLSKGYLNEYKKRQKQKRIMEKEI